LQNDISTHVLNHLINDEDYCRRVIPYLKNDYFEGPHRIVFDLVVGFVSQHNKIPTASVLSLELKKVSAPDDTLNHASLLINELNKKTDLDHDYLVRETEKWCKDRAIYHAIMDSIQIIDGKNDKVAPGAIPELLQEALGISFDPNIGHDYIDNADQRFDFYNREEEKLPFDLDLFNKITKGGLTKKSLNICLAGTGVGKSLFMCHVAASAIHTGKNVLYISLEMSEEKIAERIDANLMDLPIQQLDKLSRDAFNTKIEKLAKSSIGKLIVKEYPTGTANAAHFRALLNDLKLKKKFVPDLICIDYLNICSSSRMKAMGGSINSYSYIKAIAEELRGLAVEFDVPLLSATQTTRSGYSNSDIDLTDSS